MKNVATTKTGVEYFIFDRDETHAWGRSIRDGKLFGASRRLTLANLTFIGTATREYDVVTYVTVPTNAPSTAFAMEMPALNGDVVTQAHADYCADNGHAKHTDNGVVSPWCPRCGRSLSEGRDTGGIIVANPAPNAVARKAALDAALEESTPAAAAPVYEVTSYAPDQVKTVPAPIEAALVAIHADLLTHGLIAAPDYKVDRAPKFDVHLRPEGEGIAAFWTDGKGNDWRIEFADADRNLTELVAFEWQTKLDANGWPLKDEDGELVGAGRWHTANTMTRIARVAVERAGL